MPEILIAADLPGGRPRAHREVSIVLVDAGAGGAHGDRVIGDTRTVTLDADGEALVDLAPVDDIVPAGCHWRITLQGSSPTVVRRIAPTTSTLDGTSWADPSIAVVSPVPPQWAPLQGPPGPDGAEGPQGPPGPGGGYDDSIPADSLGALDPDNLQNSIRFWMVSIQGGNPSDPYPYGLDPSDADAVDAIVGGFGGMIVGLLEDPDDLHAATRNTDRELAVGLAAAVMAYSTGTSVESSIGAIENSVGAVGDTVNDPISGNAALDGRVTDLEQAPPPSIPSNIASTDPIAVEMTSTVIATYGSGTWDDAGLGEHGNALYDPVTEQYVAAYTGISSTDTPNVASVGLALSADGDTWAPHPQNPISGSVGGEDPYLVKHLDGTVYRDAANRALMVCEEKPTSGPDQRGIELWRSTPGTLSDWTLFGRVIDRGGGGDWDQTDRTSPTCFAHGGRLWMLFEGRDIPGGGQGSVGIGYSTDDGETWTIAPDPIITPGIPGAWNEEFTVPDEISRVGAVWVLTLHGRKPGGSVYGGRYGTVDPPDQWTADSWAEYPANPFGPEGVDVMGIGDATERMSCLVWDHDLGAFGSARAGRIVRRF